MGIFSKIAKAFGSNGPKAEAEHLLADLNKDNRVHARYLVASDGVAHVTLDSGMTGIVRDMSYGGMAIRFETAGVMPVLPPDLKGKLRILDREVDCRFTPVRVVAQTANTLFVGCTFHHDTAETLIFLRDALEPMRCGRSMTLLAQELVNERYRGNGWACLRGDGPTDLVVRVRPGSTELEEALLTYRLQNAYREVSFLGGRLSTGKSAQVGNSVTASGASMASTQTLDREILRQAAFALIGAVAKHRGHVEPLLTVVLKNLDTVALREAVA